MIVPLKELQGGQWASTNSRVREGKGDGNKMIRIGAGAPISPRASQVKEETCVILNEIGNQGRVSLASIILKENKSIRQYIL